MVARPPLAEGVQIDDIAVRILGPIEIERAGQLLELTGRRERAVLALLLVRPGQVVSLHRMTDGVWDGHPPATAVTSLRSHVSRVRKALARVGLDALLATEADGYAMRVEGLRLDRVEFEQHAVAGRDLLATGHHDEAAARLGHALELWRGDPFGDVGGSAFALAEVTRLAEAYKTVREDRIDAELLRGRHRELIAELESLVVDEPVRERLWGQRMIALYRSGRQAEALRAYSELRTSLVEHLGILPSPALQQLEVAMLCQDPVLDLGTRNLPAVQPAASTVVEPAVEPAVERYAEAQPCLAPPLPAELHPEEGTAFVGREAERQVVRRSWHGARSGTTHTVLVAGEPGIGKTTLAATLAAEAHAEGGAVLVGRCDRDALTPYQPFVEALRRFVETCDAGCLARQSLPDLRELGRLVPELTDRVPGLHPHGAAADADRFSLFEAVTGFLATVAVAHPLVLVLDDLHWADQPTCLLLRHVLRHAPNARLLVVGTYRDIDLTATHPLTDLLADLRRQEHVTRLLLRGLDHQEVAALVNAMAGTDLGEQRVLVADALQRETDGNPFFVRELVRHLQSTTASPDQWGEQLEHGEVGLPESIREVVGRRIGALALDAERTLTLAAVVGATFDLSTLEAVADTGEADVLDAIEDAVGAGLVIEVPDRPGTFAFSHALIREVAYGSLSTVRRLRLHRAVGEALEERAESGEVSHLVLAHHFLESGASGGAPAKAIFHSQRASAAAMEQLAYEEAAACLERALEVQAAAEQPDPLARVDLLDGLGHAQWRIGSPLTRATFEQAALEARALHDGWRFARAVVGLGLHSGGFASSIRADLELIELMEEALAGIGPDDSEPRARLLARLAIERYFTPLRADSRAIGDEAVAIAERLGDDRVRLVALHARAWAGFAPSVPPSERLLEVAEVADLAQRIGDREMAYLAEALRQQTLLEIGDLAGADGCCERMTLLVSELRMPRFAPWIRSYRATRAFLAGELDEADRLAEDALAEAMEIGADVDAALWLIGGQQLAVRMFRDGLEPFAGVLETMARDFPQQGSVIAMVPLLHRELGRDREVVDSYRVAASRRHDVSRDATWLIYAWALGVACRDAGGTSTAEELYDELLPYADRWAVSTPSICFGPMAYALSGYASVLGWHDAALAHVESGLASARSRHALLFIASGLVEQAEVLLARRAPDDRAQAMAALDEATHLGIGLGLTSLLRRVRGIRASA